MTVTSIAEVPTANGGRYLQQLCKHWAHNLKVAFDAREGRGPSLAMRAAPTGRTTRSSP